MAPRGEFKHESVQDRYSIGRYLRALTEGFASGKLELGADEQRLELRPNGLIDLHIKARRKSGRAKVTLRVEWTEGREGGEANDGQLTITPR